jgi:hypothetical protein
MNLALSHAPVDKAQGAHSKGASIKIKTSIAFRQFAWPFFPVL